MSTRNQESNIEDVAPLIPQTDGTTTIPLGSPLNPHSTTGHRRLGSNSSVDSLGTSPSKLKVNRPVLQKRGLVCCVVVLVALVWVAVDFSTTEKIEKAIPTIEEAAEKDQDDVAHSSHMWGRGTKPGSVKSISILGERNSGTTWLYEHLGLCFNHTVPIHRRLTRYKHWFQFNTTREDRQYKNSLVINEFRNVYDWTEAMHQVPHHAPNHVDLSWKEFVTRKWTMERVGKDLDMKESEKVGRVCQEDFYYNDVVTCNQRPYPDGYWNANHKHRYSEHQPFYEMRNDGSGEPYDNVLDLRAAKIYNFLAVTEFPWVEDMWVIRYESLLAEGTEALLKAVEKATGTKAKCKAAESQNRRKRKIDKKMKEWLKEHVDWKAERLIGYQKD
mmetsp:Transcript_10235/g.30228  ORF Transcript_10235/g.30228 Transcript_10235/m.30228 type:complete len:386 (-) Transcript_10235:89-1246(-)|eukprot:CAMPEP_0113556424 /NCGR_PEP_ID=MMETSP0015_2-20120614/17249_1 /TAXON_ID=2838 /ORGANISM="Odontella" /LENGTH=385 /DNA_ID=CAMNT_0000457779 /DNA_START=99 /DNA_END=1256 /DNA_ORIENTATION=+ /assembly_acc=CAM_ASM_000160